MRCENEYNEPKTPPSVVIKRIVHVTNEVIGRKSTHHLCVCTEPNHITVDTRLDFCVNEYNIFDIIKCIAGFIELESVFLKII